MITEDARIRRLRTPKPEVDPWKAHGHVIENERRPGGAIERALTVFLAGSECPFTCAFCDLWRYTIDGPTPRGALPQQLRDVIAAVGAPFPQRLKLYNASNFFDARAVPAEDWPDIVTHALPFDSVTVESHASMVGPRVLDFARLLDGRRLEIAIGLETVHPTALPLLNKQLDLDRFDRAASLLRRHDLDLRVFVLVGTPHVPVEESVEWITRTVRHAAECGAAVVSLIPVRGGNGELERLQSTGVFVPPTLRDLEDALDACAGAQCVVTVDLWDVDRFATCDECRSARVQRLERINLDDGSKSRPRVACARCNGQ
jgi:archaeosine synthase beta-subunit